MANQEGAQRKVIVRRFKGHQPVEAVLIVRNPHIAYLDSISIKVAVKQADNHTTVDTSSSQSQIFPKLSKL